MSYLKKKYNRNESEFIKSIKKLKRSTLVLSIEVIETSKVKDHLIYECVYLDNNTKKQINIIAKDITEAMKRLEPYVGLSIPAPTTNHILSNEKFID
jgi:hypothetical protein